MLIIPALYLKNRACVHTAEGEPGTEGLYSCDPVTTVRMWREENAKALHVVDVDAAKTGTRANEALLRSMVDATDIPIQIGGGIRDMKTAARMLDDVGAFRIIIGTLALERRAVLRELVDAFGPRRVVVALDVIGGMLSSHGHTRSVEMDTARFCSELRELGVERILYTDLDARNRRARTSYDALAALAEATGLCITLCGSVWSYRDLKELQNLAPQRVDSVVLDEALYRNVFPCQRIWRQAEKRLLTDEKTR
jgi:phosphoribosylformimino-5-aminoimidazole carboxamide ribotide isomerase